MWIVARPHTQRELLPRPFVTGRPRRKEASGIWSRRAQASLTGCSETYSLRNSATPICISFVDLITRLTFSTVRSSSSSRDVAGVLRIESKTPARRLSRTLASSPTPPPSESCDRLAYRSHVRQPHHIAVAE